jgi:hypothetical protein
METEVPLTYLLEHETTPHPEPDGSNPLHFFKNHIYILFPSTPSFPKYSEPVCFTDYNSEWIYILSHVC